jgi:hypothetical protein
MRGRGPAQRKQSFKILRKKYGLEQCRKQSRKGLIAKISANNLCQRKLL